MAIGPYLPPSTEIPRGRFSVSAFLDVCITPRGALGHEVRRADYRLTMSPILAKPVVPDVRALYDKPRIFNRITDCSRGLDRSHVKAWDLFVIDSVVTEGGDSGVSPRSPGGDLLVEQPF